MARSHSEYFASITAMSPERREEFTRETADSAERQRDIEVGDTISFEQYLANYYAAE
jgi:gamma-glutamylcysteine synthetase